MEQKPGKNIKYFGEKSFTQQAQSNKNKCNKRKITYMSRNER